MKLVRFKNGSFGITTGFKYVDLVLPHHSWGKDTTYFGDCQGTKEQIQKALKKKYRIQLK